MHIGIIVYSQTGTTLAVAEKMKETLIAAGHIADIGLITIEDKGKSDSSVVLKDTPPVDGYDALIFGAPVQAFSLCAPMAKYLKQLPSVRGVPAACYVLQGLNKDWMGGNRAIKTIRKHLLDKGADPVRLGVVHSRSSQYAAQTADVVSAAAKFAATAK